MSNIVFYQNDGIPNQHNMVLAVLSPWKNKFVLLSITQWSWFTVWRADRGKVLVDLIVYKLDQFSQQASVPFKDRRLTTLTFLTGISPSDNSLEIKAKYVFSSCPAFFFSAFLWFSFFSWMIFLWFFYLNFRMCPRNIYKVYIFLCGHPVDVECFG